MLKSLLDVFFPKRCVSCSKFGMYLCDSCFSNIEICQEFVCPMCLSSSITGETHSGCIKARCLDGMACGVVYKGVVKRLLYGFKFNPYLSDLRETIGSIFIESISQNELFTKLLSYHPIVTEVPLSSQKLKKRGYNQAEILASILADEFSLVKVPKILQRIKNTKPQFALNKHTRAENIMHAFEINLSGKETIKNKTVIVVDDLSTSCVTLRECAKILKKHGAKKVYGVTFAREI